MCVSSLILFRFCEIASFKYWACCIILEIYALVCDWVFCLFYILEFLLFEKLIDHAFTHACSLFIVQFPVKLKIFFQKLYYASPLFIAIQPISPKQIFHVQFHTNQYPPEPFHNNFQKNDIITIKKAVILLVGYFVLGPSDLYKLVKEIGKFIQNVRTLGTEATKSFESSMENQLEITELRKAQSELNEAFSFRRSINTDTDADAFVEAFSEEAAATTAAAAATAAAGSTVLATEEGEGEEGAAPKKKKRRLVRRKKKKAVEEEIEEQPKLDEDMMMEYPDLDMLDTDLPETSSDEERLRAERLERLSGSSTSATESEPDWFKASDEDIASQILNNNNNEPSPAVQNAALDKFETNRFQSQLSAQDWNSQVMANEDKLAPLSMVMQRLAILEEEKQAADRRLEEEYQRRMDNEDKFYLEKRRVLEDAIGDIQDGVYGNLVDGEKKETMGEKETESATKFSA